MLEPVPTTVTPTTYTLTYFSHLAKHTNVQNTHSSAHIQPPLSDLSGTWPGLGASCPVKLASRLGCADARVRCLRWGCCTWQGLLLHHVFHSCFTPSCGCRRKRLWLWRRVLWLELSCSVFDCVHERAYTNTKQGLFWDMWEVLL